MSLARSEARPVPRRAFVMRIARAAGVAPAVLAFLDGTGEALPRGEETDLSILYAALTIEHHAIALYDAGLRAALFPAGLRAHAVEFRGDHLGHRDTQIAVVGFRLILVDEVRHMTFWKRVLGLRIY